MIELRHLETPHTAPNGYIYHARVLQYRYGRPLLTDFVNAFPPHAWGWSEWQDIPTVSADPAKP